MTELVPASHWTLVTAPSLRFRYFGARLRHSSSSSSSASSSPDDGLIGGKEGMGISSVDLMMFWIFLSAAEQSVVSMSSRLTFACSICAYVPTGSFPTRSNVVMWILDLRCL